VEVYKPQTFCNQGKLKVGVKLGGETGNIAVPRKKLQGI
jgi:hypothetical protein